MSDEERVDAIFRDMRSGGLGWPERHRRNILAALSAARAEEREACAKIAEGCWQERANNLASCRKAGGAVEALAGKASEAHRIAAAIRGRE